MTGLSRLKTTTVDLCEWNPVLHRPALHQPLGTPAPDGSCPNPAELIVGANGKWRLCRACWAADKTHIGRYSIIREIKRK